MTLESANEFKSEFLPTILRARRSRPSGELILFSIKILGQKKRIGVLKIFCRQNLLSGEKNYFSGTKFINLGKK
jgi:hypothetical protein